MFFLIPAWVALPGGGIVLFRSLGAGNSTLDSLVFGAVFALKGYLIMTLAVSVIFALHVFGILKNGK